MYVLVFINAEVFFYFVLCSPVLTVQVAWLCMHNSLCNVAAFSVYLSVSFLIALHLLAALLET